MYHLVRICHLFRISMAEIATLSFTESKACPATEVVPYQDTLVTSQKPIDWPGIEGIFNDIISGKLPPATVRSIARSYECDVSGLYRKYPDLCKQVARLNSASQQQVRDHKFTEWENQVRDYLRIRGAEDIVPTKVESHSTYFSIGSPSHEARIRSTDSGLT